MTDNAQNLYNILPRIDSIVQISVLDENQQILETIESKVTARRISPDGESYFYVENGIQIIYAGSPVTFKMAFRHVSPSIQRQLRLNQVHTIEESWFVNVQVLLVV